MLAHLFGVLLILLALALGWLATAPLRKAIPESDTHRFYRENIAVLLVTSLFFCGACIAILGAPGEVSSAIQTNP